MLRQAAFVALLLCCGLTAWCAEPLLWIEGEQATAKKDIVDNAGLNNINPFALSGGAWLSSFSEPTMPNTGIAEYAVDIPKEGKYRFWLRAAFGSGLAYRLDGGGWVSLDSAKGLDACSCSTDGGVWYPPPLAWFGLDALDLAAGKHTLGILLGGTKKEGARWAAVDCFVLTSGEFKPNGRFKPGEKAPEVFQDIPPGKGWDFVPDPDKLDPAALLDLRYLNETEAGEHGFIKLSQDGNSFVRGDGQPIRFWAIGEGPDLELDALKRHAQFMAKRGINIVRLHVSLQPDKEGSQVTGVNEKNLDFVFKQVAAMKAAGIYSVISPYWGNACTIKKSWGTIAQPGESASNLLFFEPTLQKGYKAWIKALYTQPNPYTKTKLADEPAIAIIQIQNENSLLWWDTIRFKGEVVSCLRALYRDFLVKKYGSLQKAREAWKNYDPPQAETWVRNEWDKDLPGLLNTWDFTRDGMAKKGAWPGFIECSADQLEFFCRMMYNFNADIIAYLRKDLGCKQLVNPGNWRGPDPVLTQDPEYWASTAGDVIAKNRYTGGYHVGNNAGWQVLTGSYYTNLCVIKEPVELPTNMKHVAGHPMIIPETTWVYPNLYQSEGPLMEAAQSSLTGFNGVFWFVQTEAEWRKDTGYKWTFDVPLLLGQLPANALLYREGMVKEGAPVVVEERTLQDLWDRKTPIISEESGWDPNRDTGNITQKSAVKTAVDPLAHLVGPVQVVYGGDPAKTKVIDLTKYIDREKKTVRSVTGEIETDYGRGLYRVDTPKAQAVAGFLGQAGSQQLSDVTVTCRNKYATLVVVAMDGKPLKQSAKVLVQAGTICRPTGWSSQAEQLYLNKKPYDALKLVSAGKPPWQVENTEATVTLANPGLTKAILLDVNGMPMNTPVEAKQAAGKVTVTLPPKTLYLVLVTEPPK